MAAQGLLGLISYRGQSLRPDDVRVKRNSDEKLAKKLDEYNRRRAALEVLLANRSRDGAGNRSYALAHEKLAAWCEQEGLKDEAIAHLTTAVQFNPYRDAPWKRLGYVKHHGRWMTHTQIVAEEQEAAVQRKADRRWEAVFKKAKAQLGSKKRQQEDDDVLGTVTDVRAVPALVRLFGTTSEADRLVAVTTLSGIDGPAAAKELARLAVVSSSTDVCQCAIESLKKREPRDYVSFLIEMVQSQVEYKVQPVQGPGSQGALD